MSDEKSTSVVTPSSPKPRIAVFRILKAHAPPCDFPAAWQPAYSGDEIHANIVIHGLKPFLRSYGDFICDHYWYPRVADWMIEFWDQKLFARYAAPELLAQHLDRIVPNPKIMSLIVTRLALTKHKDVLAQFLAKHEYTMMCSAHTLRTIMAENQHTRKNGLPRLVGLELLPYLRFGESHSEQRSALSLIAFLACRHVELISSWIEHNVPCDQLARVQEMLNKRLSQSQKERTHTRSGIRMFDRTYPEYVTMYKVSMSLTVSALSAMSAGCADNVHNSVSKVGSVKERSIADIVCAYLGA